MDDSNTKSSGRARWLSSFQLRLIVSAIVLAPLLYFGAQWFGQREAIAVRERLGLIWPHFDSLPTYDRTLLVTLAAQCRLATRPTTEIEVIACLETAAAKPTFRISGNDVDAKAELDRLEKQGEPLGHREDLR